MDGAQDSIKELAAKVDLLKREVDALQVARMTDKRPWYRDIPTIIAMLALTFSFGTTYVSFRRAEVQDTMASRAELRVMLQRLAALPKENMEIAEKYAADPTSLNYIESYIGQENTLLVRQAAEIAKRLPRDQLTSTEYYAIALALNHSDDIPTAIPFAERAVESASDVVSAMLALRYHAELLFWTGEPELGRAQYQKALEIFDKYPGYSDIFQAQAHVYTQLNWANAEADSGFVEFSQEHLATAEFLVSKYPPGSAMDPLRGLVEQQRSASNAGNQ